VAHGLRINDKIRLTTTGTLPTGLAISTDYFIISAGFTDGTFQVSTTRGGSAVNTSGSQSGTHTARLANFGLGDGSTTFNLPDLRGRVPIGLDNAGGTPASRVASVEADAVGGNGGAETHTLITAEMPAHTHDIITKTSTSGGATRLGISTLQLTDVTVATESAGGGAAHNNLQPYFAVNWIIKT